MLKKILLITIMPFLISGLTEIAPAENVELVFVGFRQGDRTPPNFLPDDPNKGKWGFEGTSQLTNIGKTQAYTFGKMIRNRYSPLLNSHYMPEEFVARSSSANRCQMTMQAFLAGLYPPFDWSKWDPNLDWQPIPIGIDDPLLQMSNIDECIAYGESYSSTNSVKNPAARKLYENNKDLMNFVSNKTGWKPTLSTLDETAMALLAMKLRNLTMPDWVIKDNPWKTDLYESIMTFWMMPDVLCTADQNCRSITSGYWLGDILNKLQAKRNGKLRNAKMYAYSAHSDGMLTLLWLLGLKQQHGVYYNGAIILEYRSMPDPAVRLILSRPTVTDPTKRESKIENLPFCNDNEWCPLDAFINALKDQAIADWKKACRYSICSCASAPPI